MCSTGTAVTGEFKFVYQTHALVRCSKSIALGERRRLWRGIVTCASLPRNAFYFFVLICFPGANMDVNVDYYRKYLCIN